MAWTISGSSPINHFQILKKLLPFLLEICKSISLEEKESIRHSACPCRPRGFRASLAAIGTWRRSYALPTEAYTGRTTRGLRVVLARRRNHLHLVRLTRWQLSRVGSTQYAMELTVLRLQRCHGSSPISVVLQLIPRARPPLPANLHYQTRGSGPAYRHRMF